MYIEHEHHMRDFAMNEFSELTLENFRCFCDEQSGRLRPITLLVGENSTGKSSFMASYLVMDQCFKGPFMNAEPDFNLEPFALGSFEDIAHTFRGISEGADEFKIGLSVGKDCISNLYQVNLAFRQNFASPRIHKITYNFGSDGYVKFERTSSGTKISIPKQSITLDWSLPRIHDVINFAAEDSLAELKPKRGSDRLIQGITNYLIGDNKETLAETIKILEYIFPIGRQQMNKVPILMSSFGEVVAIAPIRSRPKRTYDPISESPGPEGDHIPMVLMRLSKTNKRYWEEFRRRLIEFGMSAELFSDIKIRDYTDGGGSPFQVQFKVGSGKFINVMDAGYGVSQCLPMVTNILNRNINGKSGSTLFLLQQPEVHLHPREQAEIGNLICNTYAEFGNRFIVETHSDFILDRVRVMVRKGIIKESDVSIIYFERRPDGNSVKIFNIDVDSDGNILNAPNSYRDFFVAETDTVLGFRD